MGIKNLNIAYWRYSKGHIEAYEILNKKKPNPMDLIWIKFYLLSRSLELSLKSYLFYMGYEEKELKNKCGHNLEILLGLVAINGFDAVCKLNSIEIDRVKHLDVYYSKKELEYPKLGKKEVPWLIDSYELARKLSDALKDHYKI